MGEYANHNGERVKIGTCESMYYLRADQRHLVSGGDLGSNPERDYWPEVRFRFPFPDEDAIEPGQFEDFDRGVRIPGAWTIPADFEHNGGVQFRAEPGYLLSIPCPESGKVPEGLTIHKNGWHGGYQVKQQRLVDGEFWTVVACGSCGSKWRLPRDVAATVAESFLNEAERTEWRRGYDFEADAFTNDYGFEPAHSSDHRQFLAAMAARILAGYEAPVLA